MYNLLISIAIGVVVALALALGTNLGIAAAIFPGLLAAAVAYFVLARRTFKKVEAVFEVVQREAQAQKFDKAVQTLQGGFVHAKWQFLVASQLHAQIGMLLYIRQDLDAALPHLEKSFSRHWIARGMLGAARYRKRDVAGATKVLEEAVKANKKEGLLWSVYAWILEKEGRHEEAIKVLAEARRRPRRTRSSRPGSRPPEREEAEARQGLPGAVVPVPPRGPSAAVRGRGLPRRPPRDLPRVNAAPER